MLYLESDGRVYDSADNSLNPVSESELVQALSLGIHIQGVDLVNNRLEYHDYRKINIIKLKATTGCPIGFEDKELVIRPVANSNLTLLLGDYISKGTACYLARPINLVLDDRIDYVGFELANMPKGTVDMSLLSDSNVWQVCCNSDRVFIGSYDNFKDSRGRLPYYLFLVYLLNDFISESIDFLEDFMAGNPLAGISISHYNSTSYFKFTDDFKFPDSFNRDTNFNSFLDITNLSIRGTVDLLTRLNCGSYIFDGYIHETNKEKYELIKALHAIGTGTYSDDELNIPLYRTVNDYCRGYFDYYAPYFKMNKQSADLLADYNKSDVRKLADTIGRNSVSRMYLRILLNFRKLCNSEIMRSLIDKLRNL